MCESYRQRAQHAHRSARRRSDANPYMVMYSILKTGSMATRLRQESALRPAAISAGQHLYGSRDFEKLNGPPTLFGADVKGAYR